MKYNEEIMKKKINENEIMWRRKEMKLMKKIMK